MYEAFFMTLDNQITKIYLLSHHIEALSTKAKVTQSM